MPPLTPAISDAELDVLKVLWKEGPLTVREVNVLLRKKKRRWAYNTVSRASVDNTACTSCLQAPTDSTVP